MDKIGWGRQCQGFQFVSVLSRLAGTGVSTHCLMRASGYVSTLRWELRIPLSEHLACMLPRGGGTCAVGRGCTAHNTHTA